MEGFKISNHPDDMDLDFVHDFISKSYWAENIPKATMLKAMTNSLCFGLFKEAGEQVGFARMITDYATFAYLVDVFILKPYQGRGLGQWFVSNILAYPELQGLRRINLSTRDAHGLYEKLGFTSLSSPENMMEKTQRNIYKEGNHD